MKSASRGARRERVEARAAGRGAKALELLYLATLALLATHEIDSAFWHEWELFGLPGGIGLFLAANLALLLAFLLGAVRVARDPRSGAPFGLALSLAGIAAFAIHSAFLLGGHAEFRTASSLAVLAATLLTSLGLLPASVRALRHNGVTGSFTASEETHEDQPARAEHD